MAEETRITDKKEIETKIRDVADQGMVDSPVHLAMADKDFELLYDNLRNAPDVLFLGTSHRAFELYVKSVLMGFKSKFIFIEDRVGKYNEVIKKKDIPKWLWVNPITRSEFQQSAEMLVCSSSDITLTEGNSTDGRLEECSIRAYMTCKGLKGKKAPRNFRKEGKREEGGGWSIFALDSDVIARKDTEKKEGSLCHDWYEAIDRVSTDGQELDKYRPACLFSYEDIFKATFLQCVFSDFPVIFSMFFNIPGGMWARWPSNVLFSYEIFITIFTMYCPKGIDYKDYIWTNIILGCISATAFGAMSSIPIPVEECDAITQVCVTQVYYLSYLVTALTPCAIHLLVSWVVVIRAHGSISLGRLMWSMMIAVQPFVFVLVVLLLAAGEFIEKFSSILGAIYLSGIFFMMETGFKAMFEVIYEYFVYKGMTSVNSEGEKVRQFVPGYQKQVMTKMVALIHTWCATGQLVGIMFKTIKDPNDLTFLVTIAFATVINVASRSGLTGCIFMLVLPMRWFPTRAKMINMWGFLHKDIKFSMTYLRFGLIWTTIAARAAYRALSEPIPNQVEPYWNLHTLILVIVALASALAEDLCVYFLVSVKKSTRRLTYNLTKSSVQWLRDNDSAFNDPFNPVCVFDDYSQSSAKENARALTYAPNFRCALMYTYSWLDFWVISISSNTLLMHIFILGLGKDAYLGIGGIEPDFWSRFQDLFVWTDHTNPSYQPRPFPTGI